ncbi:MAG: hypothetical protein Salg2KO_12100 [Salibacteraceae bacterium]
MIPVKSILVIQTSFIGDAILATSMLESLHRAQPDAKISLLVRKGNESLFANHPFLDKLFVWNKENGKYRSLIKITEEIRSLNFSAVINAHRYASSGWVTWRSGAHHRIGYKKNPLSFLFTASIEHNFDGRHETERNHELIKAFVDHTKPVNPKLYPSTADAEKINHLNNGNFYCIAPTSVWFTKQWPQEKWTNLIDGLPHHAQVYLLGSRSDKETVLSIASYSQNSNCTV